MRLENSKFEQKIQSAKNGRNAANTLNCKIFVKSEVIFEIHDKNNPMKKISCLSYCFVILPIFEISNGNFG